MQFIVQLLVFSIGLLSDTLFDENDSIYFYDDFFFIKNPDRDFTIIYIQSDISSLSDFKAKKTLIIENNVEKNQDQDYKYSNSAI